MIRTATISEDGQYRYELGRSWDTRLPCVTWIMLNPSTADAVYDDMTVKKCIGFTQVYGGGSLRIVNLYAYRTNSPLLLKRQGYPIGPLNDDAIRAAVADHAKVIVAWGTDAEPSRVAYVKTHILKGRDAYALRVLKDGNPGHPLMLSYKRELIKWA